MQDGRNISSSRSGRSASVGSNPAFSDDPVSRMKNFRFFFALGIDKSGKMFIINTMNRFT